MATTPSTGAFFAPRDVDTAAKVAVLESHPAFASESLVAVTEMRVMLNWEQEELKRPLPLK